MNRDSFTIRGLVIVVIPDDVEREWCVSALATAGFTVKTATYDSLLKSASDIDFGLIILDGDRSVTPDPIPVLEALQAVKRTNQVGVVLLTPSTSSPKFFDYMVYAKQFKEWNVACITKPFISPEHLVWYVDKCLTDLSEH